MIGFQNNPAKVAAVSRYLEECFEGSLVYTRSETTSRAEEYTIEWRGQELRVRATHTFLEDHTPEEIRKTLVRENAAAILKSSAERLLVISNHGLHHTDV